MKRVVICSSLNVEGHMHTKSVQWDDESNFHLVKEKNIIQYKRKKKWKCLLRFGKIKNDIQFIWK